MELEQKYSIAYKGLKNGLHEAGFEVDGALFKACGSNEIKDGRCKVHVAMRKSDSQLLLDVAIDGEAVCECDRCLEDCTIPVHFEGSLTVHISEQEGEYDGEQMWITPDQKEVGLMQYIYESIVLSLPYRRVHPDGGCNPDMTARFTAATDDAGAGATFADNLPEADQPRGIGADNLSKLEELKARMQADKTPRR